MNMNRFMYMSFMVTVSLSIKLHWKMENSSLFVGEMQKVIYLCHSVM